MTRDLLLSFPDQADLGESEAQGAGMDIAILERHQFPDGETKLRLPDALPARWAHTTCHWWLPTWPMCARTLLFNPVRPSANALLMNCGRTF
jgi:hypothetical protein